MRTGQRRAIRAVLIAGGILAGTLVLFDMAGLRINLTASLPVGLYIVSQSAASCVVFCPPEPFARVAKERGYRSPGVCPDGATPLMKPVVARAGDVVTVSEAGIAVNGVRLKNTKPIAVDSQGRGLSAWPVGTYPVDAAALWAISTYSPRSFDSRYFGPIPATSVRERLRPLLVW